MKTTKPASAEQTVINVLSGQPDATAAEIATAGKLGRSTVSKTLAKLESAGKVTRSEGRARRRPPATGPLEPRPPPGSQDTTARR